MRRHRARAAIATAAALAFILAGSAVAAADTGDSDDQAASDQPIARTAIAPTGQRTGPATIRPTARSTGPRIGQPTDRSAPPLRPGARIGAA